MATAFFPAVNSMKMNNITFLPAGATPATVAATVGRFAVKQNNKNCHINNVHPFSIHTSTKGKKKQKSK